MAAAGAFASPAAQGAILLLNPSTAIGTSTAHNSVKTWTESNTYALATVTIDAANPNLYIAASGAETATGLTANSEDRGFINLVQVVPEPGSAGLILAAGGLLLSRRRRRLPARRDL